MPIHYEELSAPHTSVTHAAPLSLIGGDLLSATQHAILLDADDVVMIRGTLDELRTLHRYIGDALDAEPEHVDPDGECADCQADDDDESEA